MYVTLGTVLNNPARVPGTILTALADVQRDSCLATIGRDNDPAGLDSLPDQYRRGLRPDVLLPLC